MVIEGKIVRIISLQKVIINVGENDGVTKDMIFTIYETGEEILDPETGETLGNIEFKKADVKVENTMERMSIAASQKVRIPVFMSSFLGFRGSLFTSLYNESATVLPIEEGDVNPIASAENPYIKIGDSVRQRIVTTIDSEE